MKLCELEKLVNFCNNITIKGNITIKQYYCYFNHNNISYYAIIKPINNNISECSIFSIIDKSSNNKNLLYRNNNVKTTKKYLRQCICDYLFTL